MTEEEFSERQQFKGDRMADNDLGTKMTTTGGKKKKVVGPEERDGEPAAAGDIRVAKRLGGDRSIKMERET